MMPLCRLGAVLWLSMLIATPVQAQQDIQPAIAMPPAALPDSAIGGTPLPAGDEMVMTSLPPARPCKSGWLTGAWQLVNVHELPRGKESAGFAAERFQYLSFAKDTTYKEFKAVESGLNRDELLVKLTRAEEDPLQQYVVSDEGFIYFYREGVALETLACFIVAKQQGAYAAGQMLLMPPAPADGSAARPPFVKVYKRFWKPAPPRVRNQAAQKPRPKPRPRPRPRPVQQQ